MTTITDWLTSLNITDSTHSSILKKFEEHNCHTVQEILKIDLEDIFDEYFLRTFLENQVHLFEKQMKVFHNRDYVESEGNHWWVTKKDLLLNIAEESSPCYVINGETLLEQIEKLKSISNVSQVFYAIKANSNVDILDCVYNAGFGFECVSINELEFILSRYENISRSKVLFTPNFTPQMEYEQGFEKGVFVTLDNIDPLLLWPETFRGKFIFVRIDTGKGDGHHKNVHTAGVASKFGIPIAYLGQLVSLTNDLDITIIGLHCHKGSGIFNSSNWSSVADTLLELKNNFFPSVKYFDIGGGLGVVQNPTTQNEFLSVEEINKSLDDFKSENPDIELWMEPGRFIAAESTVLLTKITQLKDKGTKKFVGVNTGFNSLIRPILYKAYHHAVNLSKLDQEKNLLVDVVGMICESGDYFGRERYFPNNSHSGDVVLIDTVGAYGRSMSSFYNMRDPGVEIFLS